MRRVVALVVVFAFILQPIAMPVASASTDDAIVRTTTLSLTPDEPGSVEATVEYDVPTNVDSLTTTVPEEATVLRSTGFEPTTGGNYTWDGHGADPALRLSLPANRTGVGLRDVTPETRAESMESGYQFVDTGPWAIVAAPPMSTTWRGDVSFETRLTTAGEGVAGERMVYLGPSTEYQRTAHGQSFTLVVPDAASIQEDPSEILDALETASLSLRVGERDPRVTFIAAPISVDWAAQGLASDADAWVRANHVLDEPNNVWLHEYVHTRANFRPASDARWTTEATAEYYAAFLSLEQDRIDFDEFAAHLRHGSRSTYASSTLTRPDTWEPGANYLKGALVFGHLDYRLRAETDGEATCGEIFSRMNARDGPVDHTFIIDSIAQAGSPDTADSLDHYATTQDVPEMWSYDEYADVFPGSSARIVVESEQSYVIRGPYRNTTTATLSPLVPGETLTLNATVTNVGDAPGEYDVPFAVDGTTERIASGSLDAGETRSLQFDATIDSAGTHTVRIGDRTDEITVEGPAQPRVTAIDVDERSVQPGTQIAVTITAVNDANRPASGEVPLVVDGTTVSTWHPVLDVGQSTTDTQSVEFDEPGEHVVRAGAQTIVVTVQSPPTTRTDTPGFTAGVASIALGVAVAMAFVRRLSRR